MTDNIELLPLPEHFAHQSERVQEHVRDYARANVANAIAPLQVEIDALQVEIDALRAEVAEWKRVTAAQGEAKASAERLAEALEDVRSRSSIDLAMRSDQFELTTLLGDIHQIADAALSKEEGK